MSGHQPDAGSNETKAMQYISVHSAGQATSGRFVVTDKRGVGHKLATMGAAVLKQGTGTGAHSARNMWRGASATDADAAGTAAAAAVPRALPPLPPSHLLPSPPLPPLHPQPRKRARGTPLRTLACGCTHTPARCASNSVCNTPPPLAPADTPPHFCAPWASGISLASHSRSAAAQISVSVGLRLRGGHGWGVQGV